MVLEYSIITTMDTSGFNVMQKNGGKKAESNNDKISSEELQTILKFGAQNLFKQDTSDSKEEGQSKDFNKLEEMNLDDILSRAEVHQGVEQSGTALGSAEFLTQFNVADVAQLSWDELIPKDLRGETNDGYMDEIPEEFLIDSRRRVSAPVSYKGADFSLDDGKRKRKSGIKSGKKRGDETSLSDKESRAIIRSLQKYGDWKRRLDDILNDADISEKDPEIVTNFITGMIEACEDVLKNTKVEKDSKGKVKVISANFGPVTNVNALVLLQRIADMEFLGTRMEKQNLTSFRITWVLKPVANWSVSWGPKDDSMLLVGLFKHGYGAWNQIQDDPDLPFSKKFFLEASDKTLPGTIHLNRRADYLLKSLKEEEGRKFSGGSGKGPRKPVPMPSAAKDHKKSIEQNYEESEYESMDENMAEYKAVFKPIKHILKSLQKPSSSGLDKSALANFVKENLLEVGSYIKNHLATIKDEDALPKKKKHIWKYASYWWPRAIPSRSYRKLFEKMLAGPPISQDTNRSVSKQPPSKVSSSKV